MAERTWQEQTSESGMLTATEFRSLGLLQEVNRLLLHPVGLAMYVAEAEDKIGVYDMREDPEGVIYAGGLPYPEKATAVADLIEACGTARIEAFGYVVQPLPPEVKQLKVSVLEKTIQYVGAPGDLDDGEELELTQEQIEGD